MDETSLDIAHCMLYTIPTLIRFIVSEMRTAESAVIPSQFGLMGCLANQPCTVSELAANQGVSLPAISRSVNTLVERNWVRRIPLKHDRRAIRLELTTEGERILESIEKHMETRLAARLDNLPLEDRDALWRGWNIIQDVVSGSIKEGDTSL
jgi:DNA-binding MarR family transcriptional regulator